MISAGNTVSKEGFASIKVEATGGSMCGKAGEISGGSDRANLRDLKIRMKASIIVSTKLATSDIQALIILPDVDRFP